MNIVDMLDGFGIEGIGSNTLKDILQNRDSSVTVKIAANEMVMLSDNTIIKCVSEYYHNPDSDTIDIKKHKNSPARCHYVQKNLEVEDVGLNKCDLCHLQCLMKVKDEKLAKRYK